MLKMQSIWILGDQLLPDHPLLNSANKSDSVIVFIESLGRMRHRPYHKRKLVLVLSAMRHYAVGLQNEGWRVDYRQAENFTAGLQAHLTETSSEKILTLAAAEWSARQQQSKLGERLGREVEVFPNTNFLVERYAPEEKAGKKLILENFYRAMRRKFGLLLQADNNPIGGAWNYDAENRKPYDKRLRPNPPLSFPPDEITRQVMSEVEQNCPTNLGTTAGFDLPVTRAQALEALEDFVENRLADFGPYEDAMSQAEPVLFHSLLSPLLNIGLLDPLTVAKRAEKAYLEGKAPLNSVEGFIRQVIGWREYVYWRYHKMMPGFHALNHWQATSPMPKFFWTGETDMQCLSKVIKRVMATGYSHHIERLMVLCNFALLAGINPKQVNDWFLESYFDAYDWVVTPNVIGMGLCADGGVVGTKPYIASAAYINRMSDYCQGCRYNPKIRTGPEACPFNFLYWNFLLKWEERLRANPRMGPNVLGLKHLDESERAKVKAESERFLATL